MKDKKQFTTIDEYISTYPADTQIILEKMRQTIQKAAPDAVDPHSAVSARGIIQFFVERP